MIGLLGVWGSYSLGRKSTVPNKQDHTLVRPEPTVESMRQAAIDMHKAITGKEPTPDELKKLDAKVEESKKSNNN